LLERADGATSQNFKRAKQATGTHVLERADRETSQNCKRTEQAVGTHELDWANGRISQIGKRNRVRDGHSPSGGRRRRDNSELPEKPRERRVLTFWRAQAEGQVRKVTETERAMGTHLLERADGGTSQNCKRNRERWHSPTGEGRRRD
jgi:hypothetical protein